jgi:hypothetical protein
MSGGLISPDFKMENHIMNILELYNRLGTILSNHEVPDDTPIYWMSEEGEINRLQSLFCGAPAELPECYEEEVFLEDGVIIEPENKPVPVGFVPHDLEYVEYRTIVEHRPQSQRFSRPVLILNDETYHRESNTNGYFKIEDLPEKRQLQQKLLSDEYHRQSDLRDLIANLDTNQEFQKYHELKHKYENIDLFYHDSEIAKRIKEVVNKQKNER